MFEVKDLEVCFQKNGKDYPAVSELSYQVEDGEILGIVGESGCGKSISSLALMGLLPKKCYVKKGEILIQGQKVTDFSPKNLRKLRGKDISMIFQEPMTALNPLLTIGKQIREAYEVHHPGCTKEESHAAMIDMMRKVGLPRPEQLQRDYPHQLSGGMRQRVVIAMALINKPAVVIADEPTTALDVTIQAQILRLLQQLNQEDHTSVVLISHDLGVIRKICSKVLVMYAGVVVEAGTADEILHAPLHPYTRGLAASIPTASKKGESLYTIPGTVPDLYQRRQGQCVFYERCGMACEECRKQNVELRDAGGRQVRCLRMTENVSAAAADKKEYSDKGIVCLEQMEKVTEIAGTELTQHAGK